MINLLSSTFQKTQQHRKRDHMFVAFELFFAVIVTMGVLFLVPSFITLHFLTNDLTHARDIEERSPVKQALDGRTEMLRRIETSARDVLSHPPAIPLSEDAIADVINHIPAGVSFDAIHFAEGRLELEGTYQHRSNFLTFVANLETSAIFPHLSSPLTNVLQERDSPFRLILSL
ncbi:MAG: hypothetical protein AAB604_02060 [Patescibacteria group bacterium]